MAQRRTASKRPRRGGDDAPAYPFFTHTACPYFPCHQGLEPERFNCLFCFCPLYALGDRCGGNFTYTESGVKVCTNCVLPHVRDEGTRMVYERFAELSALAARTPSGAGAPATARAAVDPPGDRAVDQAAGPVADLSAGQAAQSAVEGPLPPHAAYVMVGKKRLRCGYTTGTCAAAAALAAARLAVGADPTPAVRVRVPAGVDVRVDVEEADRGAGWARAAVRKFAGDDPDVTDGALVSALVELVDDPGVQVDGGTGVGRVTRAGLDQPPGAAAINSVPRRMIAETVASALADAQHAGGARVTIEVPDGAALAMRTFNPRLGIQGGISILGTTGIVRPMSEDALIASIQLEMRMLRARGRKTLLLSPGNYGRDFACADLGLDFASCVQCSNYLGAALDAAALLGFTAVLVVGHAGKLAKVAAGAMNTHSRTVDGRFEVLAALAAAEGGDAALAEGLLGCVTVDEAIELLDAAGLRQAVMARMGQRIEAHLRRRAGEGVRVEAVVFSTVHGVLVRTPGADALTALVAREAACGKEGGR
ncbi:cobalamin biosynthesis protein CbiD [Berryella wangjianweii]|uniref:Cobalt-precorrin-5B C(1)-methyltransferase n=1 Tax=Berryella wangjianweii TaxID=2734634 RepID=A0A6M8IYT1_9ACTN|nr:cobalt-precorrin-5B (C(1))-methyltransferase CbiD [Berryella wangjianweii]QKF06870.1 cobalamin biosynthesis protein CbiD [Berryella wangjianweii]